MAATVLRQETATLHLMFVNYCAITKLRHVARKLRVHGEFLQVWGVGVLV